MKPEDEKYVVQRIAEEHLRAQESRDPAVARVHQQFVRQYQAVIDGQERPSFIASRG